MSYTLTATGNVLTETREGITMPVDYSFATVNDYVHGMDVHFEELQALCLGMANHIDELVNALKEAADDLREEGLFCCEANARAALAKWK